MKQSEKLDLILRELYQYKNDGTRRSIGFICRSINIPLDTYNEIHTLTGKLKNDGYVKANFLNNDCNAELTSHGIEYCEENSYSYNGNSLITSNYSISIINSPYSNIVNKSSYTNITQNFSEANYAVEKIRKFITNDNAFDIKQVTEMLECLNEIQESLKINRRPKFAIKSLLDITADISSISIWATTLAQFAGIIPTL